MRKKAHQGSMTTWLSKALGARKDFRFIFLTSKKRLKNIEKKVLFKSFLFIFVFFLAGRTSQQNQTDVGECRLTNWKCLPLILTQQGCAGGRIQAQGK